MAPLLLAGRPASWTPRVLARALAFLAVAVLAFVDDEIARADVAGWICLGAAALQPAVFAVAHTRRLRFLVAACDAAVLVAVAIAVPDVRVLTAVLLAAAVSLVPAAARPEVHVLTMAVLAGGLLLVHSRGTELGWRADALIGAAMTVVGVRGALAYRRLNERTVSNLEEAMTAARAISHVIDLDTFELLEVAGNVAEVTGWSVDEWRRRRPGDMFGADQLAEFEAAVAHLDADPELDFVGRTVGADNEPRWLRFTGRLELDGQRRILRGMVSDVTAIHQMSGELYEQARRDRVTGLPNRQRLEEELDEHATETRPFALLIADIRQFQAINDTLGHHIGDLVLSMTGQRLVALGDERWSVYRLSADQFAVVVLGVRKPDEARVVAHQITQECRRPYSVGRVTIGAPVAVGAAVAAPNLPPSQTLRQADVALSAAKSASASVEVYHDDMQRFTLDNLVLSAAVPRALDERQFVLYFQPQVDLRTGRIVGAEGLVRWQHPERGLLAPSAFLDTLRLSTSFDRFTLGVVRQAVETAAAAQHATTSIAFAVNIELSSLMSPGFTDSMIAELTRHDIGRHRVVLEVTETELAASVIANSSVDLLHELARLREHGFEVAIDDFGTGASSLFRLDRLPADELKIDRAFVEAVGTGHRSEVLLSSIIQLGTNLGLRVVAEGIEQFEQVAYLTRVGCNVGQGWLFSKAVPPAELLARLTVPFDVRAADAGHVTDRGSVTPLRGRRI